MCRIKEKLFSYRSCYCVWVAGAESQKKSRGSFLSLGETRVRRCRRQTPPFSGSAPTTFRLYRYSNEGRPSGSGRNSYVSSNYSNFLSQNSRRKLPRSSPPRRKRNRRLRLPRADLRPRQITPRPPFPIHPLQWWWFPSSRGRHEKLTRKFQARFSYSRNSTLCDVIEGVATAKEHARLLAKNG